MKLLLFGFGSYLIFVVMELQCLTRIQVSESKRVVCKISTLMEATLRRSRKNHCFCHESFELT